MKIDHVVLGIDPGTQLGFAVLYASGDWRASGTMDCSRAKGAPVAETLLQIRRAIRRLIQTWDPELIVFEKVSGQRGQNASLIYYQTVAVILTEAHVLGVQVRSMSASTLKKRATGDGRAEKGEMKKRAFGMFPDAPNQTDHEADALLLAEFAREDRYGKSTRIERGRVSSND